MKIIAFEKQMGRLVRTDGALRDELQGAGLGEAGLQTGLPFPGPVQTESPTPGGHQGIRGVGCPPARKIVKGSG